MGENPTIVQVLGTRSTKLFTLTDTAIKRLISLPNYKRSISVSTHTSWTITPSPLHDFFIISDSLTSQMAIQDPYSTYPIVQCIYALLHVHSLPCCSIIFIWIPWHVGMAGNQVVGEPVKQASWQPRVTLRFFPTTSDLTSYIYSSSSSSNELHGGTIFTLIATASPNWNIPHPLVLLDRTSRKVEIVLIYLRISHTRMSHSYLLLHLFPLTCYHCNNQRPLMFSYPDLTASHGVPHNRIQALAYSPSLHKFSLLPPFSRFLPLPLATKINKVLSTTKMY